MSSEIIEKEQSPEASESPENTPAGFENMAVSEIEDWVTNVGALINSEADGEAGAYGPNMETVAALDTLNKLIKDYNAAADGEKTDLEAIVRKKAAELRSLLEKGNEATQ